MEDVSQTILLAIGVCISTGLFGWLLTRHLRVPGRVNALEQELTNVKESYFPLVGSAERPGAQALIRRVDKTEHRLDTLDGHLTQSLDGLRAEVSAEFKLLRQEQAGDMRLLTERMTTIAGIAERIERGMRDQ